MPSAYRLRLGLAIVCLGALVGPFDTTVNTAFPVITRAFGLAPHEIQWVVIAFVLTQSSLALVFGRLGDLSGHRRIFGLGLAASVVAHLAVGLAPDFPTLVAARVLQGLAVGLVVSCGPAMATLMFPPAQKREVVGIYVTATSLGLALGPWLGGVLISVWDWPGVFWFRAPLALAALLLMPLIPPPLAQPSPPVRDGSFDWAGAIGLTLVLAAVILGFSEMVRPAGAGLPGLLLLLAGLAGGWLFVRHELRTPQPVLRMAPFRSPLFAGVQAASVAVNLGCFANLLLIPYVLTRGTGASIAAAGLLLSLYPAGSVLGSLLAARLGTRIASARLMALGLALAALGLLLTAGLLTMSAGALLGLGMLLSGLGQGLFQVGYLDTTTSLLPAHERGVAGSLVSVTRLLGIMFGATGISWLNGLWRIEAISFALLGGGLLLVALLFGVRLWRVGEVTPSPG